MINNLLQRAHRAMVVVLPWLLGGLVVVGVIVVTTEHPGWQPALVVLEDGRASDSLPVRENTLATNTVLPPERTSVTGPELETLQIEAAAEDDAGIADTVDPDPGSASKFRGRAGEQVALVTGDAPGVATDTGREPWVIYLASLRHKERATEYITTLKSRGVYARLHSVTVKGFEYWRVFVPGFATAAKANAEASYIKDKLDLDNVWVAKRQATP